MESGMTFHRTDVGVIQALENLSESQVNDFLSGRAPLLLAMKLGDHMMFVQLQLSTSSCTQRSQTKHAQCSAETKDKGSSVAVGPVFNSTALAELGHNLSQKLRELSKLSTHPRVCCLLANRFLEIIAALQQQQQQQQRQRQRQRQRQQQPRTLDPSLQDLDGKPKRNISTIIHILNDLLGATPQYRVESPTTLHNDRNLLEHNREKKASSAVSKSTVPKENYSTFSQNL
ncbi:midnolin-B [Octopus bimaculoides]|uniref:midnolin-B n=1 Tax=Octopus bimaculoides TaxID=37653 RepID=UPI0022E7C6CC|nr:midnolin-B [Octopus bimaculoides]